MTLTEAENNSAENYMLYLEQRAMDAVEEQKFLDKVVSNKEGKRLVTKVSN